MTTVIAKFHFEAAHFLPNVPDGHKCKRVHGHNFVVEIHCSGEVGERTGWVIDFFDIERAYRERCHSLLDHRSVNDVVENPTSERLAQWILTQLREAIPVTRVVVWETSDFGAAVDA